jgi:hypothetical protein
MHQVHRSTRTSERLSAVSQVFAPCRNKLNRDQDLLVLPPVGPHRQRFRLPEPALRIPFGGDWPR